MVKRLTLLLEQVCINNHQIVIEIYANIYYHSFWIIMILITMIMSLSNCMLLIILGQEHFFLVGVLYSWNLHKYFHLHICLSLWRQWQSCPVTLPIPEVVSQNATNKSFLVCVREWKICQLQPWWTWWTW